MFLHVFVNSLYTFVPSLLQTNPSRISSPSSLHRNYRAYLQYPKLKCSKCIGLYNASTNFYYIKTKPKHNIKTKSKSASNVIEVDDKSGLNSDVAWDSLELLEWPKLCQAVAAFAGTPLGKEALKNQLCSVHLSQEQSEALLSETSAGIEFLKYYGSSLDFSGLQTVEVKSAINRLERGLIIDGKEAFAIAAILQFSNGLKNTLKIALKEDAQWYIRFMPLTEKINDMVSNEALVRVILRLVDEEGLLKDDASPDLKKARNQVCILEQRLYGLMNSVLQNDRDESNSQEISYIDGRWCVRLGRDQPTGFRGLLLWRGSGVKKYVEPVSAVPLNDELAQARTLVSKEEHVVLAFLTEKACLGFGLLGSDQTPLEFHRSA